MVWVLTLTINISLYMGNYHMNDSHQVARTRSFDQGERSLAFSPQKQKNCQGSKPIVEGSNRSNHGQAQHSVQSNHTGWC